MRVVRFSLAVSILFVIPLAAQQPAVNVSASQLLQQSLLVLQGSTPITDVTLSGTVRRIAGSDDESGTATAKALATGESRADLTLASGARSEVRANSSSGPVGSWSGPDGVAHPIPYHNMMTDSSWFFPPFVITRALSASGYASAYVGEETLNGQSVQHVQIWQVSAIQSPPNTPTFQHLSQMDFYLDATTLLPAALVFNTHPDNNALLDIPIQIRFADYRSVNGAQIPFHVQKFLNNSLLLDLQFQTVTFNSGLSASIFQVQ